MAVAATEKERAAHRSMSSVPITVVGRWGARPEIHGNAAHVAVLAWKE